MALRVFFSEEACYLGRVSKKKDEVTMANPTYRMIGTAFVALLLVLGVSCSMPTLPREIEIRGTPAYEVPAGSRGFDVTDLIDLDSILLAPLRDTFGEDAAVTGSVVDDVYTIGITQSLLSVQIGDFFTEEINLQGMDTTIEPVDFTVPSINFDPIVVNEDIEPIALPIDVTMPQVILEDLLAEPVGGQSITFAPEGDFPPIPITAAGFETVRFSNGVLEAGLRFDGLSDNVVVTVSEIAVVSGADDGYQLIANADQLSVQMTQLSHEASVTFGLAGIELPAEFAFEMTLSFSGTEPGNPFNMILSPEFTHDPRLDAASGVDFAGVTGGATESVILDTPEEFFSATVGEGTITARLAIPDDWSGITIELNVELYRGVEDIPLQSASNTGASPEITLDLAGIEITGENLRVEWSYAVSGSQATFAFGEGPEVTGEVTMSISRFSTLVVTADELDFGVHDGIVVDQELLDTVRHVTFSASALKLSLLNGLPSNLTVEFSSSVLLGEGVTESRSFAAESDTVIHETIELKNEIDFTLLPEVTDADGNTGPGIDIELSILLDGYDSDTRRLTMPNVVPGTRYEFSGVVDLLLEIDQITVDAADQGDLDTMDLSMLDDLLPPGVEITGIVSSLAISSAVDFDGAVVLLARYLAVDGAEVIDALTDSEFTGAEDGDSFDPAQYAAVPFSAGASTPVAFGPLLNARRDSVEFRYLIEAEELVITVDDETDDLAVIFEISIPMRFLVPAGGARWDLTGENGDPLIAIHEDILQRGDPLDSPINDLLSNVQGVDLNLDLVNSTGMDLIVTIKQTGNDGARFSRTFAFETAELTVELGPDEIEFIRTHLFIPEIELWMPEGELGFNPEKELSLAAWLYIDTDISYRFSIGTEDSR